MRSLTTRGRTLLAIGVVAAGAGWGLGEPAVLAVAALLVCLPLVGLLAVRRSRFLLGSRRMVAPTRFTVDTEAVVELTVENASRVRSGVLLLQDDVSDNLTVATRLVLDRVPGRAQRAVTYRVTGLERGRGRVGPLTVTVTDPFGMAGLTHEFTSTNGVIVTPRIVSLDNGRALAAGGMGETTLRTLALIGDDDVLPREHRPGDDMRRIHWRATARYGDLMVRREEQALHNSLVVVLDNRRGSHIGTGATSSFEWATSAAASIAMHHLRRQWRVTVLTTTGQLLSETGGATPADVDSVLQAFADVRLTGEPLAETWGAGIEGATAVIAVLGYISEEGAETLVRPTSGFAGCLPMLPGPIDTLRSRGWHTSGWTHASAIVDVWARLVPARSGVST